MYMNWNKKLFTGSLIKIAQGWGTWLLLAAGKTLMSCSNGRNCRKNWKH